MRAAVAGGPGGAPMLDGNRKLAIINGMGDHSRAQGNSSAVKEAIGAFSSSPREICNPGIPTTYTSCQTCIILRELGLELPSTLLAGAVLICASS